MPWVRYDRDSTVDGWKQTLDSLSSFPVEGCSIFWGGVGHPDFSFPSPSYLSKRLKSNEFVHEVGGSLLQTLPHTHGTLVPHRLCPSSFSGWRFHSSQGLDKRKPERPEITTSTLLRWQCHSERGHYPQDQFQICCPGGGTGHKTALWLSPVWDTVWESSALRILSETMVLVKSNKEETCSFTSDMSKTTGQKVFQRETGKRWLRKSLWKQLNKLQTGTSKTTPLKEPECTWISLWGNVCCKVLLETVEQSAIN